MKLIISGFFLFISNKLITLSLKWLNWNSCSMIKQILFLCLNTNIFAKNYLNRMILKNISVTLYSIFFCYSNTTTLSLISIQNFIEPINMIWRSKCYRKKIFELSLISWIKLHKSLKRIIQRYWIHQPTKRIKSIQKIVSQRLINPPMIQSLWILIPPSIFYPKIKSNYFLYIFKIQMKNIMLWLGKFT